MKKKSKTVCIVLRFLLPIACLLLLCFLVDIEKSLKMLWHLPMHIVLICIGVVLLRNWISGLRWMTLLPSSHNQISSWGAFRYIMLGSLYGLILPGALGGDVARSAQVAIEQRTNKASYVVSIWLDRLLGLFSIMLLGFLATLLSPELNNRLSFLSLMTAGLLLFVLIVWLAFHPGVHAVLLRQCSRHKKLEILLTKLLLNLRNLGNYHRTHRRAAWIALGYCIPIHGLAFLIVYLLADAIGIEIGFLTLSLFTAISWLITSIPLSFSGVGVRELSFVVLLQTQGVGSEQATSLSLGFFGAMVLASLLGVFFLLVPNNRRLEHINL
jgi:uncharacterized protein (TIRG00374 family)